MSVVRAPAAKRVLYIGPSAEQGRAFCASVGAAEGVTRVSPDGKTLAWSDIVCTFLVEERAVGLVDELAKSYVNLLVLDLRGDTASERENATRAMAVLDELDAPEDVEVRYGFHRILALVSGTSPFSDRIVLELGARGVGRVIRHAAYETSTTVDPSFGARFVDEATVALNDRKLGKRALCAAGGGITGIFFELGVMKCLDDALDQGGVNGFEMFFGISAGAVVTGPIAVGYSVDEYMAAVAGVPGGRVPALDLRLFRLGHVDVPGFVRRFGMAARAAFGSVARPLLGKGRELSREQVLFGYLDLVAPPFRADKFEELLRGILDAPGGTNDFRKLARPLFVGATDQDARRHVLFGDEEHADIPISQAIQASLSINPAFSATSIRGRYYEDGAITRTTNFAEAIRRGATLIFVVDPFLPYVARTPGYNDRRGILYNIDQDVRTISYTRYESSRNHVLRKHPEVKSYTFVPANRQRRLISQNPMDHRPYLEIWRGAYLSTYNRLVHLRPRLEGDLRAHGVGLDLSRAEAVAERLKASRELSLSDFFPDGKIAIRTPPLGGHGQRRTVEPPRVAVQL